MIVILRGPSCVGKTTIGKHISLKYKYYFIDADSYHSRKSIIKMKKGISINDGERFFWLKRINKKVQFIHKKEKKIIIACSALKSKYIKLILDDLKTKIYIISLYGDFKNLKKRSLLRKNHFFNSSLIKNQLLNYQFPMKKFYKIRCTESFDRVRNKIEKKILN